MKKPMIMMMVLMLVAIFFAWQGITMHSRVSVEEAKFHQLQSNYFNLAKVEREAAPTGSELN